MCNLWWDRYPAFSQIYAFNILQRWTKFQIKITFDSKEIGYHFEPIFINICEKLALLLTHTVHGPRDWQIRVLILHFRWFTALSFLILSDALSLCCFLVSYCSFFCNLLLCLFRFFILNCHRIQVIMTRNGD